VDFFDSFTSVSGSVIVAIVMSPLAANCERLRILA
jgi:hypothetical protein